MNAQTQTFNPEQFLQTELTEANSTEFTLIPEGEYTAVSGPISSERFKAFDIKEGPNAGGKFYSLEVLWDINDPDGKLKEELGRPPQARQGLRLDINPVDGSLELGKGRNVDLGRLREALGINRNGQPFRFSMLGGQVAKIKVKHRMDKRTQRIYAEVAEVSAA